MNKKKGTLGDSHPKTLRTMRDLAVIWQAQNWDEEALSLMSKVVDFSETVLGVGHPDTVSRKQDFIAWGSQPYQSILIKDN